MIVRKIVSVCLSSVMIISAASLAYADNYFCNESPTVESISFSIAEGYENELTVERTINGSKVVVEVKDKDGNLLAKAQKDSSLFVVTDYSDPINPVDVTDKMDLDEGMVSVGFSEDMIDGIQSIKWGSWSSKTVTLKVDGLTAAAIIATLVANFSLIPINIISDLTNVFVNFPYQYATVKIRMRTGTDSKYQYAQEEITIWGRNTKKGTKHLDYGPSLRQQKKLLTV